MHAKYLIFLALPMLLALGIFIFLQTKDEESAPAPAVAQETTELTEIDVKTALKDRVLGNPKAPVKIAEYSSLTCGHCGTFHATTFKALKSAYLDTGKAYLIFRDFPLNAPALHGSMLARCLPEEQFFPFIQDLFIHQKDWAYEADYLKHLKNKAKKAGLSKGEIESCLASDELKQGIIARIQAAQKQWKINSTPSFVINNKTIISGAQPFENFAKILDQETQPAP